MHAESVTRNREIVLYYILVGTYSCPQRTRSNVTLALVSICMEDVSGLRIRCLSIAIQITNFPMKIVCYCVISNIYNDCSECRSVLQI